MGWFRRSGQAARNTDPLFSWGERIGKLLWEFFKWVVGPSTVSGLALVGLGWATYGLFYGALAGAVAFALIQLSLTLRLFRQSAVEARPSTEPQPEGGAPQSTSTDTDTRQAQEAKIERLETTIRKQQERLNRYDGNRLRFKELLQNALTKGLALRESKPSKQDAKEWAQRVHDFIEDANARAAHHFMYVDPGGVSNDLDATPEQAYLDKRTSRLSGLIQEVVSDDAMPFRKGFDSHDYDLDTLSLKTSKEVFQDESIEIARLTRQLGHFEDATGLRGLTFVGCTIHGPAILDVPDNVNPFDDCRWEPSGMPFWLIHPTERPSYGGTIKLENCIFRRCTFRHVGRLVNPEKFIRAELPSITR